MKLLATTLAGAFLHGYILGLVTATIVVFSIALVLR